LWAILAGTRHFRLSSASTWPHVRLAVIILAGTIVLVIVVMFMWGCFQLDCCDEEAYDARRQAESGVQLQVRPGSYAPGAIPLDEFGNPVSGPFAPSRDVRVVVPQGAVPGRMFRAPVHSTVPGAPVQWLDLMCPSGAVPGDEMLVNAASVDIPGPAVPASSSMVRAQPLPPAPPPPVHGEGV
jgi:hypothetical protein